MLRPGHFRPLGALAVASSLWASPAGAVDLPEVARPKSADERLQAERAERAKEAASIQRQEGAKQRSLFSGWALRGPDVDAANQAKQAADAERARAERDAAKAADELKLQEALSAVRVHCEGSGVMAKEHQAPQRGNPCNCGAAAAA